MTTFFTHAHSPMNSHFANLSTSSPSTSADAHRPLKRRLSDEVNMYSQFEYESVAKRPHYEERISNDLEGISLDELGSFQADSPPPIIDPANHGGFQEVSSTPSPSNDYPLHPSPCSSIDDFDEPLSPVVEEPDDEQEQESPVVLSDELKRYMAHIDGDRVIPVMKKTGKELVLYAGNNEINSRISEVVEEDTEMGELGASEADVHQQNIPFDQPQPQPEFSNGYVPDFSYQHQPQYHEVYQNNLQYQQEDEAMEL